MKLREFVNHYPIDTWKEQRELPSADILPTGCAVEVHQNGECYRVNLQPKYFWRGLHDHVSHLLMGGVPLDVVLETVEMPTCMIVKSWLEQSCEVSFVIYETLESLIQGLLTGELAAKYLVTDAIRDKIYREEEKRSNGNAEIHNILSKLLQVYAVREKIVAQLFVNKLRKGDIKAIRLVVEVFNRN